MKGTGTVLLGFLGGLLGAWVGNFLLNPGTVGAQATPPDATFNAVSANKITVQSIYVNGIDVVDAHSKGLMSIYFNNSVPTIALLPEGDHAGNAHLTPTSLRFDFSHPTASPSGAGFASYGTTGLELYNIGAKSDIYADTVGDSGKPELALKVLGTPTGTNSTLTTTGLTTVH